jgi:tRNA(Glu) U13 pseudouridine synthase TruD
MIIKQKPEDFIVDEVIKLDLSGGDYHYFKLTKKNRNTLDVIKQISRTVPRNQISFAGTKDKVAITTLLGLKISHNNYVEALQRIDKKLFSLYLNAYQSHLWNEVAKKLLIKNMDVPLLSFGTKFSSKKIQDLYETLMKKEGISKKDFILRSFPDQTPLPSTRPLLIELRDFSFTKPYVSFFLPKGSYATVALDQMQ